MTNPSDHLKIMNISGDDLMLHPFQRSFVDRLRNGIENFEINTPRSMGKSESQEEKSRREALEEITPMPCDPTRSIADERRLIEKTINKIFSQVSPVTDKTADSYLDAFENLGPDTPVIAIDSILDRMATNESRFSEGILRTLGDVRIGDIISLGQLSSLRLVRVEGVSNLSGGRIVLKYCGWDRYTGSQGKIFRRNFLKVHNVIVFPQKEFTRQWRACGA